MAMIGWYYYCKAGEVPSLCKSPGMVYTTVNNGDMDVRVRRPQIVRMRKETIIDYALFIAE